MTKLLPERARLVAATRRFFEERGFLEVETPLLVPSPGLDVHLSAFEAAAPDLAPATRWLTTSPEYQMKRLLADGWTKIFQIGKAFRSGEVGSRHNPEFTILEWYRANAGMDDVLADTEQLVEALTAGAVRLDRGRRVVKTRAPFRRMTVCEAFAEFAEVAPGVTLAMAESDEDRFFRTLVDQVEPALAELDEAVFLTDYPASQASLARKRDANPRVAERFELYVAGVELCNGFGELTDPKEQRERLVRDQQERRARGLPVYPIDTKFLAALERGLPPSGGNAAGLDRVIALACGRTEVRDVMAFTWDEL